MNNKENGEEEDRFFLLFSFKIKLLLKTCLPICLEGYQEQIQVRSIHISCDIFTDYTL